MLKKIKKMVILNWKANPKTIKEAEDLFKKTCRLVKKEEVVVAPPVVFLDRLAKLKTKKVLLASQDAFYKESGAYTGEVTVEMLKSVKVGLVIIGHSERRAVLEGGVKEFAKRAVGVLELGLKVIFCVGENKKQSKKKAEDFVDGQIKPLIDIIKREKLEEGILENNLIVAYEPVWAIGTGKSAIPDRAGEMADFIKDKVEKSLRVRPKVLYGGSVDGGNVSDYLFGEVFDGVLVGGASLKVEEVKKIIDSAER